MRDGLAHGGSPKSRDGKYNPLIIVRLVLVRPASRAVWCGCTIKVLDLGAFSVPTIGFVRCSIGLGGTADREEADPGGPRTRQVPDAYAATIPPHSRPHRGNAMYNANEQFADIGKVNYANAVRARGALASRTRKRSSCSNTSTAAKAALGAGRRKRASRRVGQGRPGARSRSAPS